MKTYGKGSLPLLSGMPLHIQIPQEELPNKNIVVGDKKRAQSFAELLHNIKIFDKGRLFALTGDHPVTKERIGVFEHPMGSGCEITFRELMIMASVDLKTRTDLPESQKKKLKVIRLGTCGMVQERAEGHWPVIIPEFAFGIGILGLFKNSPSFDPKAEHIHKELSTYLHNKAPFIDCLHTGHADESLRQKLLEKAKQITNETPAEGIVYSATGFYADQGRVINEISGPFEEMDDVLRKFTSSCKNRVEAIEMEVAFGMRLFRHGGHHFAAILQPVASRSRNTFMSDEGYLKSTENGKKIVLGAFE